MPRRLSIVAAIAVTLIMIPALASAAPGGKGGGGGPGGGGPPGARGGPGPGPGARGGNVTINRGPVVGKRYHGGIWYGTGPRFWRGQWYPYGVGPCWLVSPIGYVWICG